MERLVGGSEPGPGVAGLVGGWVGLLYTRGFVVNYLHIECVHLKFSSGMESRTGLPNTKRAAFTPVANPFGGMYSFMVMVRE